MRSGFSGNEHYPPGATLDGGVAAPFMDELFSLVETILRSFAIGQNPQAFLVLIGLAFARLLAFLQVVPFFGGTAVPPRVKVATATAFVIIVYPSLAASLPANGE